MYIYMYISCTRYFMKMIEFLERAYYCSKKMHMLGQGSSSLHTPMCVCGTDVCVWHCSCTTHLYCAFTAGQSSEKAVPHTFNLVAREAYVDYSD